MIAFLLSDRAAAITGQAFLVDAGHAGTSILRIRRMRVVAAVPSRRRSGPRLPPELLPLFDDRFVRSCDLFEEYVLRLAVQVFQRDRAADSCRRDRDDVRGDRGGGGLDPGAARVPVDWILRTLALRGVSDRARPRGNAARYRSRVALPELDPNEIADAQERLDPAALASYRMAAWRPSTTRRCSAGATGEKSCSRPTGSALARLLLQRQRPSTRSATRSARSPRSARFPARRRRGARAGWRAGKRAAVALSSVSRRPGGGAIGVVPLHGDLAFVPEARPADARRAVPRRAARLRAARHEPAVQRRRASTKARIRALSTASTRFTSPTTSRSRLREIRRALQPGARWSSPSACGRSRAGRSTSSSSSTCSRRSARRVLVDPMAAQRRIPHARAVDGGARGLRLSRRAPLSRRRGDPRRLPVLRRRRDRGVTARERTHRRSRRPAPSSRGTSRAGRSFRDRRARPRRRSARARRRATAVTACPSSRFRGLVLPGDELDVVVVPRGAAARVRAARGRERSSPTARWFGAAGGADDGDGRGRARPSRRPPIDELIPHRPPMLFVDGILGEAEDGRPASARVPQDCALVAGGCGPRARRAGAGRADRGRLGGAPRSARHPASEPSAWAISSRCATSCSTRRRFPARRRPHASVRLVAHAPPL